MVPGNPCFVVGHDFRLVYYAKGKHSPPVFIGGRGLFSQSDDDVYDPRIITDLALGYDFNKNLSLTLGANNLLNVYPSIQDDGESETGGYWDAVQMGFSGAFYFAKLGLRF